MISETVSYCGSKTFYQKLQEYELLKYKTLHKVILDDTGVPTLNKRAFRMPGYRAVVGDNGDEAQFKQYEQFMKVPSKQESKWQQ